MRRFIIVLLTIALALPFLPVLAENNEVIVLTKDSDLAAALDTVADNGTIQIYGGYIIPEDFQWENHGKTITFTGGILNFTKNKTFIFGDNVIFKDIKLKFVDDSYLFANGFDLYVHNDVVVDGKVILYGGGKHRDVQQTNLTLMGGTFFNVYGGSNTADVLGDVNVTIGGDFNKNLKISHSHDHQVIAGGYNCEVHGNVNLTFGDNAKANYVYGGSSNTLSRVNGHINLNFTGGEAMSVCGGSKDVNQQCDVYLNFSGGRVEQIFGGCEKASMVGNVLIRITGGEVTRRVYGGCYNNYTSSGWQDVPNYVYGNILLLIGENAELRLKGGGGDNTLFAHSRQVTVPKKESAHIAFTSEAAQTKFKNKIGPQDGIMKRILGKANAYDGLHILSYSVSGDTLTQHCTQHDAATITVSVTDGIFTGEPQKNATITVSENWLGPAPIVEYSDNVNVGVATVKITAVDAELIVTYMIWPPIWVWVTAGAAVLLITGGIVTFILIKKKKKKAAT